MKEKIVSVLDDIPIEKEGETYVWQVNLESLEEILMSKRAIKQISGIYKGDTLFLYGTESPLSVKDDEDINTFFPRAIKVPVKGSGHIIHQDNPEEFLKQITDFIFK